MTTARDIFAAAIADAIRARLGELQAQGLVTEQQVNQIIDAYSRLQSQAQARRYELRRYIRRQASDRQLWHNWVVIDETHLWRGQ